MRNVLREHQQQQQQQQHQEADPEIPEADLRQLLGSFGSAVDLGGPPRSPGGTRPSSAAPGARASHESSPVRIGAGVGGGDAVPRPLSAAASPAAFWTGSAVRRLGERTPGNGSSDGSRWLSVGSASDAGGKARRALEFFEPAGSEDHRDGA